MATVHYGRLVGAAGFAKTVAIKRLHRSLANDKEFRGMILAEGRLAARVRHPNVVPPLDVLAEGGELLLVMEYVHGESIARLLRASTRIGDPVPLPIACAVLSNVLHGLHAAHEARDEAGHPLDIVHRDVSPQNVLVGVDGVARVIDFGIAKATTSEGLTSAGTIKGKVPYLSPEQLEGEPATRRTDIYAASVVLWELLAGRRLFEGADDAEILRNILFIEVKPPSVHNPLVSSAIDDIVLRGLRRAPAERFATAREMAVAIEEAVHLATPTVIGAWVERLAATTLGERAAHLEELEAIPAAPLGLAEQESEIAIPAPPPPKQKMQSAPPPAVVAKPSVRASAPAVRPPAALELPIESRTVIYEPPPQPEPEFVEGVRALAAPDSARDRLVATHPAVNHPPLAGALRKPELEIRNVDWMPVEGPPDAPAGSAFFRFLRYLGAFLVLTLVVGYMFAPALTRAWLVTNAEANGITISIEQVEVAATSVRLRGFKAESKELTGVSVHATNVVVGLDWLRPSKLTIDDAELSLDGSYITIAERLDIYKGKHPGLFDEVAGGIRRVDVTSGRVDWKSVIGDNTSALVENITLEMEKVGARPIGADYHLTAPLFTMHFSEAPAGPWQIDIDRQGILSRAIVRFDPTGSYPVTFTRTAADDGSLSLSLQIPPTSLRDLHLPRALLGAMNSDRTRLGAQGEISIVGGAPGKPRAISGHLAFTAQGVNIFPNGPVVDLSLDVPIDGPVAQPVALSGVLTVGTTDPGGAPANAPMVGTLDLSGRIAHVVLTGQTSPIPCMGADPKKRGVGGTGVAAAIDAPLDDYPTSKLSFKPVASCNPRFR